MRSCLIYGLVDPRTEALRYVGKTTIGHGRYRAHLHRQSLQSGTHKNNWIKSLMATGLAPKWVIIQDFGSDGDILSQAEIFWIAYFRKAGHKLTNLTPGGDGNSNPTQETIEKQRAAHLGKRPTPEARRNMSLAQTGRKRKPMSEDRKRRLSTFWLGKPKTPAAKAKLSKTKKGKPPSDATRAAVAQSNRTRGTSAETRQKRSLAVSAGLKGRTVSPETRARISASLLARKRKV